MTDVLKLSHGRTATKKPDGSILFAMRGIPEYSLNPGEALAVTTFLGSKPVDHLRDVEVFHAKFEIGYDGLPRLPTHDLRMFRLRFQAEELKELGDALGVHIEVKMEPVTPVDALRLNAAHRLAQALDALVDQEYVLLGTVSLLGLSTAWPEAFRRVHAANMQKVRGVKPGRAFSDARWDITKPPNWVPPDHSDLVASIEGES